MVDLATFLPNIQQHSLDPPFVTMDRQMIDLNQHAFDLNEVPLSDTVLDCLEGCSPQSSLIPRKGGWLELFSNMFGQDKVLGTCSSMADFTHLNNVSVSEVQPCIDPRTHGDVVLDNARERQRAISGYGFANILCHTHPQNAGQEHLPFGVGLSECKTLSIPGHQLNSHTAEAPSWDLNTHPMPQQQSKEIVSTVSTKTSSMESFSSYPNLTHDSRKSMQDLLLSVMKGPGYHYTQLSDVLEKNAGRDSVLCSIASLKQIGRSNSLTGMKGNGALGMSTIQESKSYEDPQTRKEGNMDPQCSTVKDQKMEEPRIRIVPSPDWLPAGWITEVKTRKAGSTAGTTDKYYKDPVTGRRCRSKNEVMNFLQTGRLGRNKPQMRALESLGGITTTMSLLPPLLEHTSGELNNYHGASSKKQTFLPHMPRTPFCQSLCSQGLVLERLLLGAQEQEKFVPGVCEAQDAGLCMDACKWFPLQGEAERNDISCDHGCLDTETPQVPGKRKFVPDDATLGRLSKRICCPIIPRQGNSNLCTGEVSATNRGAGITRFAGLSSIQAKGFSTSCPDPLVKQEETIWEASTTQPLVNARALGLYRFPKLTLKQERELLHSLGKKLCQQFVDVIKEEAKG